MSAKRNVAYPNHYTWLVLVSALDIFMTFVILTLGGWEANALAAGVMARFGLPGMVVFKMVMVSIAIVIAEEIAKRDDRKGRKFAEYAIVISAFPVIFALTLVYTQT